jgi:hypothetical protein
VGVGEGVGLGPGEGVGGGGIGACAGIASDAWAMCELSSSPRTIPIPAATVSASEVVIHRCISTTSGVPTCAKRASRNDSSDPLLNTRGREPDFYLIRPGSTVVSRLCHGVLRRTRDGSK